MNNNQDLSKLTERERLYYQVMKAKSGVLFITAKPGVAKSAIARSIADKMDMAYEDVRLSMSDETDFKFPHITTIDDVKVSDYAVPRWAFEANKRPTILHFEELNRAPQFVRNAALQILLERQIGNFKFNDNVFMMASGNLGDEDGTDVEEFDSALNNRLIHYPHTLSYQEWIDNFAQEKVHPSIVSFINAYPDYLYQDAGENTKAYATPRSWTFLSDFIIESIGKKSNSQEVRSLIQGIAFSYIGNTSNKFLKYLEEQSTLNINDIIDNFDGVKKTLEKFQRDKKSELIQSLKEMDIKEFKKVQVENTVKFLKTVQEDELTAYLLHIIDTEEDIYVNNIVSLLTPFKTILSKIDSINDEN